MQHQGDRDKALERIVAWIKAPAKERSLMPAAAIERFGLMAPLPLPDDQLRAAFQPFYLIEYRRAAVDGENL